MKYTVPEQQKIRSFQQARKEVDEGSGYLELCFLSNDNISWRKNEGIAKD